MKLIAITVAAAVGLSGCAGLSPLAVDSKLTPEAQAVQARAKADADAAIIKRLDYCQLGGSIHANANAGSNGGLIPIPGAGAGFGIEGSFTCTPKPWETPHVPAF